MNSPFIREAVWVATILAALASGLMGGVFFAFSNFVMKALARLSAPQGIAAMQAINITVVNPLFASVLFGTAAGCMLLAVYSLTWWRLPGSGYLLAGSLLYLVGALLTTGVFNVPLNDALARVDPASSDGASLWARYLTSWLFWNHIRTITSIMAAAAFIRALFELPIAN